MEIRVDSAAKQDARELTASDEFTCIRQASVGEHIERFE
jgi:hypothetical protein